MSYIDLMLEILDENGLSDLVLRLAIRRSDGARGVILAINPATGPGGYAPTQVLFHLGGHLERFTWENLTDLDLI